MTKPTMSMSMIQSRSEIQMYIARGKGDRWVTPETHHVRDLIRDCCRGLDSTSDLFALKHSESIEG
jgi:hypothetical protein